MISEKMISLVQGNSIIRAMFEEGNALAEKYGRENVYDFSLGNPNFPAPDAFKRAVCDIVTGEEPMRVHGYMSNAGFPDVRKKVADSLNARFDTSFGADNIIMSVGAAGGLNVVLKTLVNPGDEIIVIAPYFLEYANYINNYDGKLVVVNADKKSFQPDVEALKAAITPKTKAVIINTPNNPTGVVYTEDSLKKVAAALAEKEQEFNSTIYLISDEPYRELCYDGAVVPYVTKYYKNSIICYSWSKSLSLPGERIGYIVVPGETVDSELIINAAGIATRVLGFVNAPSLIQLAVAECLDEQVDVGAYDQNRKRLYKTLTDCGFDCVYPDGAFYMWVKAPGDDKEFSSAAKKYNILIVPGSSFACPGYVRIAYCVAKETIERSAAAFKKLAEEFNLSR